MRHTVSRAEVLAPIGLMPRELDLTLGGGFQDLVLSGSNDVSQVMLWSTGALQYRIVWGPPAAPVVVAGPYAHDPNTDQPVRLQVPAQRRLQVARVVAGNITALATPWRL